MIIDVPHLLDRYAGLSEAAGRFGSHEVPWPHHPHAPMRWRVRL